MTAKHTPCYRVTTINVQGDNQECFEVYADDSREQTLGFVFDENHARLIAAAPEMLALLRKAINVVNGYSRDGLPDTHPFVTEARALLARIENGG